MEDIISKGDAYMKASYLFNVAMATSTGTCSLTMSGKGFNILGTYATKDDIDCFYGLLIPHALVHVEDNSFFSAANDCWLLSLDVIYG